MLPTLPSVFVANAKRPDLQRSADQRAMDWNERTKSPEDREVAVLAYETATARLNGLEAKGVGVLQACALVAAGALVASASRPAQVLGVTALLYVAIAGWACIQVLVPAPREAVTTEDIGKEDAYARIATYVDGLTPTSGRVANLVTGATYDLARGWVITLAALLLAMF